MSINIKIYMIDNFENMCRQFQPRANAPSWSVTAYDTSCQQHRPLDSVDSRNTKVEMCWTTYAHRAPGHSVRSAHDRGDGGSRPRPAPPSDSESARGPGRGSVALA
jgi:hypothetical protein